LRRNRKRQFVRRNRSQGAKLSSGEGRGTHPIYTGTLTAVLGTTLAVGRYRALIAFAMILAALVAKSRQEEKLLDAQFGPAFEEHCRHTGFFPPRLS